MAKIDYQTMKMNVPAHQARKKKDEAMQKQADDLSKQLQDEISERDNAYLELVAEHEQLKKEVVNLKHELAKREVKMVATITIDVSGEYEVELDGPWRPKDVRYLPTAMIKAIREKDDQDIKRIREQKKVTETVKNKEISNE